MKSEHIMNTIITATAPRKKRNPFIACALSVFFTGLGQIYNGDAAKGVVLLLLRVFTVCGMPFALLVKADKFFPVFFAVMAFAHLTAWLVSALDALYSALMKKSIVTGALNSLPVYLVYSLISSLALCAATVVLLASLTFMPAPGSCMRPSLEEGEVVAVSRNVTVDSLNRGDVVMFYEGGATGMGRILARPGDRVRWSHISVEIDGAALDRGVPVDAEAWRYGVANSEQLFYEISGDVRYLVMIGDTGHASAAMRGPEKTIGEGELLVGCDNRREGGVFRVTGVSDVIGRVEMVVWSKTLSRLLLRPALNSG